MKATEAGKIQIDTMEAGFFERWARMNPHMRVLSLHYQIRYLYVRPSGSSAQGAITSQEMVMVVSEKP